MYMYIHIYASNERPSSELNRWHWEGQPIRQGRHCQNRQSKRCNETSVFIKRRVLENWAFRVVDRAVQRMNAEQLAKPLHWVETE